MQENINQKTEIHHKSMPHVCASKIKEESSMWKSTKASAAKAWDVTKEEVVKAWDKTKELGSDISEKFSSEESNKHGIYEFDATDEINIDEPMSDYEDEELRMYHSHHHSDYQKDVHHNSSSHSN